MKNVIVALTIIVLLIGCAGTPTPPKPPNISRHDYNVSVVNRRGNPISGVTIFGKSLDRAYRKEKLTSIECKTSKEGTCFFPVDTTIGYYVDDLQYVRKLVSGDDSTYNGKNWKWGFATAISIKVEPFEYFYIPNNDYFCSYDVERSVDGPPAVSVSPITINLVPLKELLCRQNLASQTDMEDAHHNIERTVNTVREQAKIKDFHLESFRISSFKSKDYISCSINYPVVFNSEKNTRYENVRDIVDMVVRGVVGIMDANFNDWCVAGYNITIHAERRSFIKSRLVESDPSSELLILDMYLPKETVHQYKENDITGQRLIDSSIILLNGERIDVKMY